MAPSDRDGSSTSRTTRSRASRRSPRAPSGSASPGSRRALVSLAERHGLRPRKALGQHFLIDGNLARAIARDAGAVPGSRFLEVGAGLGSLTVALADAGSEVLAIEIDDRVAGALREVVAERDGISVVVADAMRIDWPEVLGSGTWRMASNLPYNVGVPVLLEILDRAPNVDPLVVMVQREVGERLAAPPGSAAYGAGTVRAAYQASVRVLRRVPPSVFWPEPRVESVVLRLDRRPPPVAAPKADVFRLIQAGFAQRRKTLASALVRLGMDRGAAREALIRAGLEPSVRAEALSIEEFGRLAEVVGG